MKSYNYDWSKFFLKINIKSSSQKIYNSWATQENLEGWFLRLAEFTKSNGTIRKKIAKLKKATLIAGGGTATAIK